MSFGGGLKRDLLSKRFQDVLEMLQDGSKASPSASQTPPGRSETALEMPSGGLKTLLNASKTLSRGAIERFSLKIRFLIDVCSEITVFTSPKQLLICLELS